MRDGWGERPSGVDGTRAAFSIDGSGEFILCAADFVTTHVARDRNGLQHALVLTIHNIPLARCRYMFYETGVIKIGVPSCIRCVSTERA